jgi:hypothetical protein
MQLSVRVRVQVIPHSSLISLLAEGRSELFRWLHCAAPDDPRDLRRCVGPSCEFLPPGLRLLGRCPCREVVERLRRRESDLIDVIARQGRHD